MDTLWREGWLGCKLLSNLSEVFILHFLLPV